MPYQNGPAILQLPRPYQYGLNHGTALNIYMYCSRSGRVVNPTPPTARGAVNRIFREEYWKAAEVVLGSAVVAIWRNGGSNGAAC